MKTKMFIGGFILILGFFTLGILTGFKYAEPKQTEEYAWIYVRELGSSALEVCTTIGEQPTTQEELKFPVQTQKGLNRINYGILFKKMHELNAKGFELVNMTESPVGNMTQNSYCYIFKRKLN